MNWKRLRLHGYLLEEMNSEFLFGLGFAADGVFDDDVCLEPGLY